MMNYYKTKHIKLIDIVTEVDDLHLFPDGAVTFRAANNTILDYNISIADSYYIQYRRTNGISKLGVSVNGEDLFMDRTIEGLISFADLLNGAYMRTVFKDIYVVTGINYFPGQLNEENRIDRVTHFMGSGIFPLCLSLLLPIFVYSIVSEKEGKVLEIMKMNGMKMHYYWLVNFLFDFLVYWLTVVGFVIVGGAILGITVFLKTSYIMQFLMFAGWGYAEIGMAFVMSPFLSRAQTATSNFS
jgi:hypothetical protein